MAPEELNDVSICSNINESTKEVFKSQEPPPNKRKKYNKEIVELLEDRRKERNEIVKNVIQNRDDDIDVFFKSIAMSIKKLSPELINEAKMKSLQTVFDLEKRNAFVHLPQYSPSPSTSSFTSQSVQSANNFENTNQFDLHYLCDRSEPSYEQL